MRAYWFCGRFCVQASSFENYIAEKAFTDRFVQQSHAKVQTHLQTTVFNRGGCKSYYLDANGRNFAAWPWSLNQLKQRLKHADLSHYDTVA